MRLSEIRGSLYKEEVPLDTTERQELLRQKIENNEKPFVSAARYAKGQFGWGDLEALGWARKESTIISRAQAIVEEWWLYAGPNSIMAEPYYGHPPVEMRAGDTTPKIEVDYS